MADTPYTNEQKTPGPSGPVYNNTYIQDQYSKLSKNEKFLLTGMVCVTVMTLSKIRAQHKQLEQMLDVATKAMEQLAQASKR